MLSPFVKLKSCALAVGAARVAASPNSASADLLSSPEFRYVHSMGDAFRSIPFRHKLPRAGRRIKMLANRDGHFADDFRA